jgi:hypothetical protein
VLVVGGNNVNGPIASAELYEPTRPTAVGLASLTARRTTSGVVVTWRTASEVEIAGFHVYRGSMRVNRSLIVAKHAGTARGAVHRLLDRRARRGVSYTYRLQVVRLDGTRAVAGLVSLR